MKLTKHEQTILNHYNTILFNTHYQKIQYLHHLRYTHKHYQHYYEAINQILDKMQSDYRFNHKLNLHTFKVLTHYIQHNMHIPTTIYNQTMNITLDKFKRIKHFYSPTPLPQVDYLKNRNQFLNYETADIINRIKYLKHIINYNNLHFGSYPISSNVPSLTFSGYHQQKRVLKKLLNNIVPNNYNDIITSLVNNPCYYDKHNSILMLGTKIAQYFHLQSRTNVLRYLVDEFINDGVNVSNVSSNHKLSTLQKQIKTVNQSKANYIQSYWYVYSDTGMTSDGFLYPIGHFKYIINPINNTLLTKIINTILYHCKVGRTGDDLLNEKFKRINEMFFKPNVHYPIYY